MSSGFSQSEWTIRRWEYDGDRGRIGWSRSRKWSSTQTFNGGCFAIELEKRLINIYNYPE